jgi:hypothetical protein
MGKVAAGARPTTPGARLPYCGTTVARLMIQNTPARRKGNFYPPTLDVMASFYSKAKVKAIALSS